KVLDNVTYTVTSNSQFVTASGNPTCVAGTSGANADEVSISSSVSWTGIGTRPPVMLHSVVTPPIGGAVVVSATTPVAGPTGAGGGTGLAGMRASLSGGPTPPAPATTDSTGCAIFGGLTAGNYTLSLTPPTGYIDKDGNTSIADAAQTVTAT